ncbi:Uncharacterised protein g672 [Pycnogonum litorale]
MDLLREIRLLYEAFHNFKSEVSEKLNNLDFLIRRQEEMYDIFETLDRRFDQIMPSVKSSSAAAEVNDVDTRSYVECYRSQLEDDINSAPPEVEREETDRPKRQIQMFRSDPNLTCTERRLPKSSNRTRTFRSRRNSTLHEDVSDNPFGVSIATTSYDNCFAPKVKPDIMTTNGFESKQDSGLDSDQKLDSLLLDDDPLVRLLDEIQERAAIYNKQNLVSSLADSDRHVNLLHERSKMASNTDVLNERLKCADLEKENLLLRIKEMNKTIVGLEDEKQLLLDRLQQTLADRKQVKGKIGGMHLQFVKKNRERPNRTEPTPAPTPTPAKIIEPDPPNSSSNPTKSKKLLVEELNLSNIVQETDVVELKKKLIKSIVKNHALQTKLSNSSDQTPQQPSVRSRVMQGGTFKKPKSSARGDGCSKVADHGCTRLTRGSSERQSSSLDPTSCKTFLKTLRGDSYLIHVPETQSACKNGGDLRRSNEFQNASSR